MLLLNKLRRTAFDKHDLANMKSPYEEADEECLDPIQLTFANGPRLENVQFLDPGIIDLDCDSEEECKYIDEDTTDISLPEGATTHQTVTYTHNCLLTKLVSVELVDCYKFPWYFDQTTKDIISKKLAVPNDVDSNISEEIMEVTNIEFRDVFDKCLNKEVDKNISFKSVNSHLGEHTIDSIEFSDKADKCINKEIEERMSRVNKMFNTNHKIDPLKRMASTKKRNDKELLKAISQRNKTGIDLKKNKGLVGLRIKSITTSKPIMEIKNNMNIQAEAQQEINNQEKSNKLYVEAVDKTLMNLGTTITPVPYKNPSGNTEVTDLSVKSSKKIMWTTLEDNKIDLKHTLVKEDSNENDTSRKVNETAKVAKEIVRILTSQEEVCHMVEKHNPSDSKQKLYKAMPLSKKIEHGSKLQRYAEECKMTKLITPVPLSLKASRKEKNDCFKKLNNFKTYETKKSVSPIVSSSSLPKQVAKDSIRAKTTLDHVISDGYKTENKQSQIISEKPASPTQRPDVNIPNKTFATLNRFTKNILNKIQAQHMHQSKMNKYSKLYRKHALKKTNYVVNSKSTDECKPTPTAAITKSKHSLEGKVTSHTHYPTGATKNNRSPKVSLTELQYTNITKNSPKMKKNHVDTNTLPLNTIIMKTPKTDDAKIDGVIESTIAKVPNSTVNNRQSNTVTEQHSTANITVTKGPTEIKNKNIEGYVENKLNTIPVHKAQKSPDKFTIQTIISSRNETDCGRTHSDSKSTLQTRPQVSAIIIRPTQTQNHQAQVNKSLTAHASLQSHILYKPQAENRQNHIFLNNSDALRYQTPMQQVNQPMYQQPVNSPWYSPWYTKSLAPATPVNRSPGSIPDICPQRSEKNPPQMAMNVRLPGVNRDIPRHEAIHGRAIPESFDATNFPPIRSNANPKGVSAGIPLQAKRLSGANDMQTSNVFWSYAFPPPIPPPPPPFLPSTSQTTTVSPSVKNNESSIIGRNNDGIIKKINITATLVDRSPTIDNKEGIAIENELDTTPLYDEVTESETASTKTEMLRVLDVSMQRMKSPVEYLEVPPITISSNKSVATDLKRPLPIKSNGSLTDLKRSVQRNEILAYKSKQGLSQQVNLVNNNYNLKEPTPKESNLSSIMNLKPQSPYRFNEPTVKKTKSVEPSTSYVTQPNKVKSNESSEVNHTRISSFSRLFEDVKSPIEKRPFEDNEKPGFHKSGSVSSKIAPPTETKNTSSAKYKPGPLSKKTKFNDPRVGTYLLKTKEEILPSKGYSAPILPIPTYEKILSEIPAMTYKNFLDKPVEKRYFIDKADAKPKKKINMTKKRRPVEQNRNKINYSKKISLDEYKKRSASERRTDEDDKQKLIRKNTVDIPSRASNVDSDLGYDSDSTVKL